MSGKKRQQGQATRADIIGVARQLFSQYGYHSTGIADIQDATGLTKGAFYHHFQTKQDLALAVLERASADYETHLTGPAMQADSAAERLERLLDGIVSLNARPDWLNCQMMATLAAEVTASDGRLTEAVRAMFATLLEMWQSLIEQAQQEGEVADDTPAEVWAQWIVNTLVGSLLARKLGTARVDPTLLVEQIKRLLLRRSAAGRPKARSRQTKSEPRS